MARALASAQWQLSSSRRPGDHRVAATNTHNAGPFHRVVLVAGAVNVVASFGYALVGRTALATAVDSKAAVVFMNLPILAVNLSPGVEVSTEQLRACGRRFWPLLGSTLVGVLVVLAMSDGPSASASAWSHWRSSRPASW